MNAVVEEGQFNAGRSTVDPSARLGNIAPAAVFTNKHLHRDFVVSAAQTHRHQGLNSRMSHVIDAASGRDSTMDLFQRAGHG